MRVPLHPVPPGTRTPATALPGGSRSPWPGPAPAVAAAAVAAVSRQLGGWGEEGQLSGQGAGGEAAAGARPTSRVDGAGQGRAGVLVLHLLPGQVVGAGRSVSVTEKTEMPLLL